MKVKIFITEQEDVDENLLILHTNKNKEFAGVDVSRTTTHSRIKSSGFNARTSRKVPILTNAMKNMRLKVAKVHQHMMTTDWRKVIFLSIVLFKSNNNWFNIPRSWEASHRWRFNEQNTVSPRSSNKSKAGNGTKFLSRGWNISTGQGSSWGLESI